MPLRHFFRASWPVWACDLLSVFSSRELGARGALVVVLALKWGVPGHPWKDPKRLRMWGEPF